MSISTSRESDKFVLRLPDGMRDALKHEAEQSGRSMNAEIVHRLKWSLDKEAYNQAMQDSSIVEGPEDTFEDSVRRSIRALEQMLSARKE